MKIMFKAAEGSDILFKFDKTLATDSLRAVAGQDFCFTAEPWRNLAFEKGLLSAGLKRQVVVDQDCSQIEQLYWLLLSVLLVTNGISHCCSTTRQC